MSLDLTCPLPGKGVSQMPLPPSVPQQTAGGTSGRGSLCFWGSRILSRTRATKDQAQVTGSPILLLSLAQGQPASVASRRLYEHLGPGGIPPPAGVQLERAGQTRVWPGSLWGLIQTSLDNSHLPRIVLQLRAQAPQAFFSSTDSGNKLTPLNCGKWELIEKLIDMGGLAVGRGDQRRKGKAETSRLSHWRGPAPLALIGAGWV